MCLPVFGALQCSHCRFPPQAVELINDLLEMYTEKGLQFLRSQQCKELIPCSDINVVESLTRYLQHLLHEYLNQEVKLALQPASTAALLHQGSGRFLSREEFLDEDVQVTCRSATHRSVVITAQRRGLLSRSEEQATDTLSSCPEHPGEHLLLFLYLGPRGQHRSLLLGCV